MEQDKILPEMEAGYMEDIVEDIHTDVKCMFHALSSYKKEDEAIEELAGMFNLSISEIEQIIHEDE